MYVQALAGQCLACLSKGSFELGLIHRSQGPPLSHRSGLPAVPGEWSYHHSSMVRAVFPQFCSTVYMTLLEGGAWTVGEKVISRPARLWLSMEASVPLLAGSLLSILLGLAPGAGVGREIH